MGKQKQKWIVVTQGLKPGVYRNWLVAAPYVNTVREQAVWQGFENEGEARALFKAQKKAGHIKILTDPDSSSGRTSPPSDNTDIDTDTEPPTLPRRSARLTSKLEHPKVKQETPGGVVVHSPKVSVSYPHDLDNAYYIPRHIGRSLSTRPTPTRGSPATQHSSPHTYDSRSPSVHSSNSSTGSVETAFTSLSLRGAENVVKTLIRTTTPMLSPLNALQLRTPEEVSVISSNHNYSPRSSPLKKSSLQKPIALPSPALSPTAPGDIQVSGLVQRSGSPCLSPHELRNVTISRGSPSSSRQKSPKKFQSNNSREATDVTFSYSPGPSNIGGLEVRSPLKKKNLEYTFYDSCSSNGRPSPKDSRWQKFQVP